MHSAAELFGHPIDIHDSLPKDAHPWSREFYIPVRREDLKRLLADRIEDASRRERFARWSGHFQQRFQRRYRDVVEDMKRLYAPLDPDADTLGAQVYSKSQRKRSLEDFFSKFDRVLATANYRKLKREEIEEAMGAASEMGVQLRLNFEHFEHVEVHVRGDVLGRRTLRRWFRLFREEVVEIPIYRRLVVVYQFRNGAGVRSNDPYGVDSPNALQLRLFKNIPKADVDMMLPGGDVKFSVLDRGKIILPTFSGMMVALYKLIKIIFFTAVLKTLAGLFALAFVVLGAIGYLLKSVFGYYNTRDRYHLNLTRSLYFQHLDTNAGVFLRIADEAAEQECRECMLAYYLLSEETSGQPWSPQQLAQRAESLIREMLAWEYRFEATDALAKLAAMGLAAQTDEEGRVMFVAAEAPRDDSRDSFSETAVDPADLAASSNSGADSAGERSAGVDSPGVDSAGDHPDEPGRPVDDAASLPTTVNLPIAKCD